MVSRTGVLTRVGFIGTNLSRFTGPGWAALIAFRHHAVVPANGRDAPLFGLGAGLDCLTWAGSINAVPN